MHGIGTTAAQLAAILMFATASPAQIPGLTAGQVTASIDGAPFSAKVNIAILDDDGTLVLTSLSNAVQIQVPDAREGTFAIELDDDGNVVGTIVGLKAGRRLIAPVSGTLTIETLTSDTASGRFELAGKDADENAVEVTDGRFEVKLSRGR